MINKQDRIREHIKVFVKAELMPDLAVAVGPNEEVQIICTLSGG